MGCDPKQTNKQTNKKKKKKNDQHSRIEAKKKKKKKKKKKLFPKHRPRGYDRGEGNVFYIFLSPLPFFPLYILFLLADDICLKV